MAQPTERYSTVLMCPSTALEGVDGRLVIEAMTELRHKLGLRKVVTDAESHAQMIDALDQMTADLHLVVLSPSPEIATRLREEPDLGRRVSRATVGGLGVGHPGVGGGDASQSVFAWLHEKSTPTTVVPWAAAVHRRAPAEFWQELKRWGGELAQAIAEHALTELKHHGWAGLALPGVLTVVAALQEQQPNGRRLLVQSVREWPTFEICTEAVGDNLVASQLGLIQSSLYDRDPEERSATVRRIVDEQLALLRSPSEPEPFPPVSNTSIRVDPGLEVKVELQQPASLVAAQRCRRRIELALQRALPAYWRKVWVTPVETEHGHHG